MLVLFFSLHVCDEMYVYSFKVTITATGTTMGRISSMWNSSWKTGMYYKDFEANIIHVLADTNKIKVYWGNWERCGCDLWTQLWCKELCQVTVWTNHAAAPRARAIPCLSQYSGGQTPINPAFWRCLCFSQPIMRLNCLSQLPALGLTLPVNGPQRWVGDL